MDGGGIRVLEVSTCYPRFRGDFSAIFNFRIDRELVNRGIFIRVIAPGDGKSPVFDMMEGIEIRRFTYLIPQSLQCAAYGSGIRTNVSNSILALLQTPFMFFFMGLNIIRHGREADIIHCHWLPTGLIGWICRPFTGGRLVLTVGGTDVRSLPPVLCKFVLARMDAIVSPNFETTENLKRMGFGDHHVIPTVTDEKEFNPTLDGSPIREEFEVGKSRIVTWVGRLYDFKDPMTFLRSIPHILDKRHDVEFFIVGEGILSKALKDEAESLGIADRVHMTGARADVNMFLAASDLFCGTSSVENVGANTVFEAMFMRVPLILTDAGCTAKFFSHMENAFIVPAADPKAISEAVLRLLDDSESCSRIAKGAEKLLDIIGKRKDRIVDNMLMLYWQLIRKNK